MQSDGGLNQLLALLTARIQLLSPVWTTLGDLRGVSEGGFWASGLQVGQDKPGLDEQ